MKIIAIDKNQFDVHAEKAWGEIYHLLQSDIDSPIFIDSGWIKESKKSEWNIPSISCVNVKKYFHQNSSKEKTNYFEWLQQSNDFSILTRVEKMLCLNFQGISIFEVADIAHQLAKVAFIMPDRPTIYLLLVDGMYGSEMSECWYHAFYIAAFPPHYLTKHLSKILKKMRIRAFVLRCFGIRVGKFLQRLLQS